MTRDQRIIYIRKGLVLKKAKYSMLFGTARKFIAFQEHCSLTPALPGSLPPPLAHQSAVKTFQFNFTVKKILTNCNPIVWLGFFFVFLGFFSLSLSPTLPSQSDFEDDISLPELKPHLPNTADGGGKGRREKKSFCSPPHSDPSPARAKLHNNF